MRVAPSSEGGEGITGLHVPPSSVVFVAVLVCVLLLEALRGLLSALLPAPAVRVSLVGLEQLHLQC